LSVPAELYQVLWKGLEKGLLLQILLIEAGNPALQDGERCAERKLLLLVLLNGMSTLALEVYLGGLINAIARCSRYSPRSFEISFPSRLATIFPRTFASFWLCAASSSLLVE
jgi:hypothetical protein